MRDLEAAKERLEELADYEETKRLAVEAEVADLRYDLAYSEAVLKAHREGLSNPTLLKAFASTDANVQDLAMAARTAKGVWQARQEAARNARAVLDGERSLNADRRAIV